MEQLHKTHGSWAAAARALRIPASTLRSRADTARVVKRAAEPVKASSVVIEDEADLGDIRRLCADRGLDVDRDWIVVRSRLNNWGGPDGLENTQPRVDLEPRFGLLCQLRVILAGLHLSRRLGRRTRATSWCAF